MVFGGFIGGVEVGRGLLPSQRRGLGLSGALRELAQNQDANKLPP